MSDMDTILTEYPTLRPRTDVYSTSHSATHAAAYNDGRSMLLLLLDGTIAVPFHGSVYNIPMHFWFPRVYPQEPPIVYVVPMRDMLLRSGAHTTPEGCVQVPYIHTWLRKPEASSLLELVRECQAAFSLEPPVMAKRPTSPPAPPPLPRQTVPAVPPLPPKANHASPRETEVPEVTMPAPPRPMNPAVTELHTKVHQQLSMRVAEMYAAQTQSDAQLRMLLDDLERGAPALEDEMQRLRAVRDVCVTNTQRLSTMMDTAKRTTWELEARPEPDVDHMMSATSLVENQLLQLMADDQAIEDTLYQLSRALYSEQLSLDRFIKHTRMLSREQFLKRALAQNIAQGLGWDAPLTGPATPT